ncbi:Protein CYP-33C9 [Aphelenchoides avenae]|nr:Protein CYP-33C9 [Aphelenchus avenae]
MLFYNYYWKRRGLPPGPTPLPLVGNLLSVARQASTSPYEAFNQWRKKYGPVYTYWVGEKPVVAVTDFKLIQETFVKDGDTYAGRYLWNDAMTLLQDGSIGGVILTEGEEWRTNRRFALQALREFGMGRPEMEGKVLAEVDYVLNSLRKNLAEGVVEHRITNYTDVAVGSIINQMLFGYRFSEGREAEFKPVKQFLDQMTRSTEKPAVGVVMMCPSLRHVPPFSTAFQEIAGCKRELSKFLDAQIEQLSKDFKSGKLSETDGTLPFVATYLKQKAQAAESDPILFREDQLRHFCQDLWGAGQETTSTTMQFAILYLLLDVDAQSRMQAELDRVVASDEHVKLAHKSQLPYTHAVVNEIQRLCNLLPDNLYHRVMRDVDLNGYHLPKGTMVVPQISCVLSDEKTFPEPDRFKPERFLDANGQLLKVEELVPFSVGKRICPGESLARMELFLLVANIFHQFKVRGKQLET